MINDSDFKNNFNSPFFYEKIVTPFGQLFGIELKYNSDINNTHYTHIRNSFFERERRVAIFKKKILFSYSVSHLFTTHRMCCLISEDLSLLDVILKDRMIENFIARMPFIWLGINNTEELSLMIKKRLLSRLSERHIILLNDFLSDSEHNEIVSTGFVSAVKINNRNPDISHESINFMIKKATKFTPLIITKGINNMYIKGVTAIQLQSQHHTINSELFSNVIPSFCSNKNNRK
ncbi:hypothetical protein DB202_24515 [Salmonella enterica]|nr:hypothetical protein [Salmonella enterica]EBN3599815.1 hypothetical protein [Salmonella enterica]EBN5685401.1 hypothetical protein [Salmonella enterica]ECC9711306.1 hypothetical protein [Salmonella enterica subsp. enterica]